MPTWDDYIDTGGGLLLAYESKDVDVYFEDGRYGPQLTIKPYLAHPEDYPRIADGILNNWYSLGNGWRIGANGATAEPVEWTAQNGNLQDAPKKFRRDKTAGALVAQMQAIDPDGLTLAGGLTPYEAAYWKAALSGKTLWGPIPVTKREQDTDGKWADVPGGKDISMPIDLCLGAASTNGAAPAEFDIATLGLTPEVLSALQKAAAESASQSVFVAKAASIPGVSGERVLQDIANNQAIYAALSPM